MERTSYPLVPGYLKMAGYTLEATAKSLGITRRSLDNKISGTTEFTLSEAKKIREIVGKPIDDIFLPSSVA